VCVNSCIKLISLHFGKTLSLHTKTKVVLELQKQCYTSYKLKSIKTIIETMWLPSIKVYLYVSH